MKSTRKQAEALMAEMADAASFYSFSGEYEGLCRRKLVSAFTAASRASKLGTEPSLRTARSRWKAAKTCFVKRTGYSYRPR